MVEFDKIYCLNQPERIDRWELANAELKRVGIKADWFYSIPDKEPYMSFCLSQRAMIDDLVKNQYKAALLLEDDVLFRNYQRIDTYTKGLPENWDILYLGANVTDPKPEKITDNLFRIRAAWTTHAIAYNNKVFQVIDKYNPETNGMYDDWLSREVLPNVNAYVIIPMIAWQRPGHSDLWGKWADYTGAFQHQSKMIK